MSFPPTYDFADDATFGEDVIFTDIHVDPNSLPAPALAPVPAINDNISDEEEEDPEEDPEEEDPEMNEDESSDEPDDNMSEDEPVEAIPSFYTRGGSGSRTRLTARKSVRFPSTDYASSSRAHGRSNVRISSHTPSPTPSPTPSSPIIPQLEYTPSSEPPSPMRSSPFTPRLAYSPTSPLSSPPFPGNLPEAATPPPTSPHSRWIDCWNSFRPTQGASTSAAPLPQPPTDPRVAQLMGRASDFHLRITQLEDSVEILPGPAQLEDLDHQVQDMEERLLTAEHRAFELNDRVLFRGGLADQVQRIDTQLQAMEAERDFFRSRVQDLERRIFGRAPR